jgi:O-acetyl-ADP-ribose deacetylase (regulator of RNase III)
VEVKIGNTKLILTIGDITESETESIVNAANSTCMGGAGVDGAIHSKGGPQILQECIKIRKTLYPDGLPPGEALITTGGNLKAKYVIHTVGPICNGPMTQHQKQILKNAYQNSLKLALEKNIKSISFPSISTGAYRCDVKEASKIALKAVIDFLKQNPNKLDLVAFVLFTREIYNVYKTSLEEIFNANFDN